MAGTRWPGGGSWMISRFVMDITCYQTDIMLVTIVILVVLVQILQGIGMMLSRKLDKRKA